MLLLQFLSGWLLLVASFSEFGVLALANGHNIYKDMLRGKTNEASEMEDIAVPGHFPKLMYFYRIPSGIDSFEQPFTEIGKRASDHVFKHYMLNREKPEEITDGETDDTNTGEDPVLTVKRGPGAAISWALASKRPNIQADLSFLISLLWPYSRAVKQPTYALPNAFYATKGKRLIA
ncbi:uncharacterized protein LOC124802999 isoform X1 [Schistocerca piceifrons]|uniref:uncharacterized protein LOC124802999 isoform X1 n=1 Tax=Schistocerca piceifrons TaxID=274613 RepID=UPI001F5FCE68|nr:uncharacterized protein LOC124802999 isoform X1 [Schistocerca piceifrons]